MSLTPLQTTYSRQSSPRGCSSDWVAHNYWWQNSNVTSVLMHHEDLVGIYAVRYTSTLNRSP